MMLAAHRAPTMRQRLELSAQLITDATTQARALHDAGILDSLGLRRMRLGERSEQQLDQLTVPHALFRSVDDDVRRLQSRQQQLHRAVEIAQRERAITASLVKQALQPHAYRDVMLVESTLQGEQQIGAAPERKQHAARTPEIQRRNDERGHLVECRAGSGLGMQQTVIQTLRRARITLAAQSIQVLEPLLDMDGFGVPSLTRNARPAQTMIRAARDAAGSRIDHDCARQRLPPRVLGRRCSRLEAHGQVGVHGRTQAQGMPGARVPAAPGCAAVNRRERTALVQPVRFVPRVGAADRSMSTGECVTSPHARGSVGPARRPS